MSKTAFLTGATGFLGTNLVEALHAQGWTVHAIHRASSNLAPLSRFDVRWAEGELLDADSVAAAMPEAPDAVFHVAANITMWKQRAAEQTRDNVEGTRAVLAAAKARGAKRFVHTSSWATYGLRDGAVSEDTPQRGGASPRNYARSKYAAEQLVKAEAAGLGAVVLNPSHIIGRHDRGGWGRMFLMVQAGKLPGVPPGSGSFCHAAAVAQAHIAAAERGRPGHNYLLGGTDATFLEVVQLIGELTGKPVPRKAVPKLALSVAGRLKDWASYLTRKEPDLTPEIVHTITHHPRVNSSKARDELGYEAAPLRAMLEDAYGWLVEAGHLPAR